MSRKYHERFRIREITDEARDVRRFVLDRGLASRPGNFVKVLIPGVSERPFSVMNSKPLELGVKRIGEFTGRLFDLEPGQEILVRGPYGNSFLDFAREGARKLLVCGGCGYVPLEFLARSIGSQDVRMLVGARCGEELPPLEGLDVVRATDDGSAGLKGMVTEHIAELGPRKGDQFFICGPERMMAAAAREAARYVEDDDIIISAERYMKCGRGICGSCELDGFRVCVDGPVFRYSQLKGGDFGTRKRLKSGRRVPV